MQKRPIILRSLLIVATPYVTFSPKKLQCVAVCCSVLQCCADALSRRSPSRQNATNGRTLVQTIKYNEKASYTSSLLFLVRGGFGLVCVGMCWYVLVCVGMCPKSCMAVLQCVALCCGVVQCVAVCLYVCVPRVAWLYCSVLQCVAVCCGVLQCVAVYKYVYIYRHDIYTCIYMYMHIYMYTYMFTCKKIGICIYRYIYIYM